MKSMRKLLWTLLMAMAFAGMSESKDGNESSGGGDKDGLSAAAALRLVPSKLREHGPDLVTAEELKKIEEIASSDTTLIMMTEEKQPSLAAGITQLGTAYSVSGKRFRLTTVFRKDWEATHGNPSLQIAFMTHEACVMAGLEQTGAYGRVSAAMLNRLRNDRSLELTSDQRAALDVISREAIWLAHLAEYYLALGVDSGLKKHGIKSDCDFFKHLEKRLRSVEQAAKQCHSIPNIVPLSQLLRSHFSDTASINDYCALKGYSPRKLLQLVEKLPRFQTVANDLLMAIP